MVLHNSKWDRKATKDRARKFKAKGKDLPEVAAQKQQEKQLSQRSRRQGGDPSTSGPPRDTDKTLNDDDGDDDDDTSSSEDEMGGIYLGKSPPPAATAPKALDPTPAEAKSGVQPAAADDDDDDDAQDRGKFSRRKLVSNAYRYELPPEDPNAPVEPAEPEPDYVALTAHRVSALEAAEEKKRAEAAAAAANLDADFLRDLDSGGYGRNAEEEEKKTHVVKVDRREFVELQEKIKKRDNVEAFRKRFGSAGGKGRGRGGGGTAAHAVMDDGVDDVDAFLEDLGLDDAPKSSGTKKHPELPTPPPVTAGKKIPPIRRKAEEEDDEWLDAMLEVR